MDANNKQTDADLLRRFGAGEEDAFRDLVNRYKHSLYAFLRRFINQNDLIEDVFQETFLQLFNSRESFDMSRPLRPWLFTIAANKAKDALRKQQRTFAATMGTVSSSDEMTIDDVLDSITSLQTTPYDEVAKSETADAVREIIEEMPENLKEILILAYFHQFSYKHMAEMLSIPIGTVKSRLHTAVGYFTKKWKNTTHGSNE